MERYESVTAEAFNFMKSRVILTAAELDLFTKLDEKPTRASDLAGELHVDTRALTRILDYLVSLEILSKEGGIYHTTDAGTFLSSRHPETILPMILHLVRLWKNWSFLTETVKGGSARKREPVAGDEEDRVAFIGAMHVIGRDLSAEIADGYDLSRFRLLLDVGGASGTYASAFLRKNPQLKAVIFDLEPVIPHAKERMEAEGLLDRVTFASGDFYKDELPSGADLALLSAIIHQNSTEENIELYGKVLRALNPGGYILIRDHIMDETRTKPAAGALFALNMVINTQAGDTYTFREVKDSLEKAGFVRVKLARTGEKMDCLVEAEKPV
jgi:SAM-dependent methyltransferase